jgi:hypothetical protein
MGGEVHEAFTRLGHRGGTVYLDLGDADWRAVEISAHGWQIIADPPVKFGRSDEALPLPEPERGGSLDDLRPFVNVSSDNDWAMVKAWLIGAMAPDGAYTLLAIYGEQGSGKSSTSGRLREVIDPTKTLSRETPRSTQDLAVAARTSRVLVFDNLSWLTAEMSDALARLSTGGGFGTRRLYTDDEESTFYAKRPVILNGIEEVATRGDLLSRAIVAQLPRLAGRSMTLAAGFERAHPCILGALLDATTAALRRWDATEVKDAPRMADFARWVEASGVMPGFLEIYTSNRTGAIDAEIDASAFATAVIAFVEDQGSWEGQAHKLLEALNRATVDHEERGKRWPASAKAVSDRLRRHAPALRERGVQVDFRQSNGRKLIALRSEGHEAPPAAGLQI